MQIARNRNLVFKKRVVQYTRTDTTRIRVCSFSNDLYESYRSLNNVLRVEQLVNCISLERLSV